ncbi:hypothetical protein [Aequorivita lipolytica]|uniref:hypothetical protein n=1 Tax=Aequorivita lipolytica TaxID=153267 RepID=UPI000DBBB4D1|nr:hypothetical protein [Aequorivita lipolytica]SRX50524.1 hypothetical protein AEQU2_00997 [Aequorivita lipolytica]
MTLEKNLKERIKELTCLYEVSSIIVNNDYKELDKTLYSVTLSLRKSLQYSKNATVPASVFIQNYPNMLREVPILKNRVRKLNDA